MVAALDTPERVAMKRIVPKIIMEKPIKKARRLAMLRIGRVFITKHYNDSAQTLPMGIGYDTIKNP